MTGESGSSGEPSPPQHSPDGRWYWNGFEWRAVPATPGPRRPWLLPAAILGGVALLAAIVAAGSIAMHQIDLKRCTVVPDRMVAAIETGASIPGYQLGHVYAVQSRNFQHEYFISARVSAPGLPNAVGTWSSNRLEAGAGLIFAVDPVAQGSTDWGRSGPDGPHMDDEGADLSRSCAAER